MLDVFAYFGSFHGLETLTEDGLRSAMNEKADCPILYWYNGYGPKDTVTQTQSNFCEQVENTMTDILVDGENYAAVVEPEAEHTYDIALLDLYNFSQVVFTRE